MSQSTVNAKGQTTVQVDIHAGHGWRFGQAPGVACALGQPPCCPRQQQDCARRQRLVDIAKRQAAFH